MKRAKMKPVLAWAIVRKDGVLYHDHNGHPMCSEKRKEAMRVRAIWFGGSLSKSVRIARVRITEVTK